MTVLEDNCECGSQIFNVEYKQEKNKLPNNCTEMKGCIFCTSEFSRLVDKPKVAVSTRPRTFRGGKGGGGKGRGRGNKGRPPKDKMSQLAAYFV